MKETSGQRSSTQESHVANRERRKFLQSAVALAASVKTVVPTLAAQKPGTPVDAAAIRGLKAKVRGEVLAPGDADYDAARTGFELSVAQQPAVVVMMESPPDVVAAVNFARLHGLGVGVQGTGHGLTRPANGGLLVNTSRMKGVEVFADRHAARVQPGAKWKDVGPLAQAHGLVPLSGSSTDVGVLGYTLGGGTGWFARHYGYAANSVISADVVTADGRLLHASEKENPGLFWGIRGGTGNFGIITSLEFKLYPVKEFYGGSVYFPAESARDVLLAYSRWVDTLPDTFTSRVTIYNLPPIPAVPAPLRGRWVIAVQGVFVGPAEAGADLLKPIHQAAKPVVDTFAMMNYSQIDTIANDPQQPMAVTLGSATLREISPVMVDKFLPSVGIGERSLLVMVEMRHLGGALAAFPPAGSAAGRPLGKFWLNSVAIIPTPESHAPAEQAVARIDAAVRPFCTGRVFLNGLGGESAQAEVPSAYSPENYHRLVALKRQYDPTNLFRFNRNIPPGA